MQSMGFRRPVTAAKAVPTTAAGRSAGPGRIGLFGLFGSGNTGNDGSLEAMLGFLRQSMPGADLLCFCPAPGIVEQRFHIPATSIAWPGFTSRWARKANRMLLKVPQILGNWLRTLRQMQTLDVLVFPGTGILDDFGTGPFGMPYTMFRCCLCARLCGTRIWFVSTGAGPIRHPASRWLLKRAAGMAEYRSYRDSYSRDYMAGIGLDVGGDPVFPDLAFKLPVPVPAPNPGAPARPLTIGVGVMAYNGWRGDAAGGTEIYEAYRAKIVRFVLWLLESGHRVRILTGDRMDRTAVEDVVTAVRRDLRIPADGRIVAEPCSSLHELMRQMADTDLVVATRFHNIVCALKMDRPTLSISYAKKNDVLLAEFGLGAFCQDIEQLDPDRLMAQVTDLIAHRAHYARSVRAARTLLLHRLDLQEAHLSAALKGDPLRGTAVSGSPPPPARWRAGKSAGQPPP